jgi:hypothetical protein
MSAWCGGGGGGGDDIYPTVDFITVLTEKTRSLTHLSLPVSAHLNIFSF